MIPGMAAEQHEAEIGRMAGDRAAWRRWGPYLSERQWGTVREDYSAAGTAWDYFPHDMARSRAYRWGEDGIAGVCDEGQRLCLALALWNGQDAILKERLFGLTNREGNHGEDVKEYYYYLDAVPSHAYLKMLYKYPQRAYPYAQLLEENRRRGAREAEFELIDTGIFAEDRYFDILVEYAKADPDDLLLQITADNRGPDAATVHLLPQLWFRNTWSWRAGAEKPEIARAEDGVIARHAELGNFYGYVEGAGDWLFCDNETNAARLFGAPPAPGYWKDAFHELLVHGQTAAVNPAQRGTKAGAHRAVTIPAGGEAVLRLRLSPRPVDGPFRGFAEILAQRKQEADDYFAAMQQVMDDADARLVQRQALAGMIWNKQYYYYDVPEWLRGDPAQPPPPPERRHGRNAEWTHVNNADVISMPDCWEFPWYANWDLCFHCVILARLDAEFAKNQLVLMTREWYMHPNGQLPGCEWDFNDVYPPLLAWAAWRVFQSDRARRGGTGDLVFLERIFLKMTLDFTWWVNRKDVEGRNIFQGGFLGLDNIGVFDRSAPLPRGGYINQSDGTSWMAMFCLTLLRIALELAQHQPAYEDMATKFFEHFLYIAQAMTDIGGSGVELWDEQDGFYYDVLTMPDHRAMPLKVRSMVGLIPLFAVETLEPELLARLPSFAQHLRWFLDYRPDLAALVSHWTVPGRGQRRMLSLLRGHRMKALIRQMVDPQAFLSDYGVRSLSRYHAAHPYKFTSQGQQIVVRYEPGEAESTIFGGNSNWRGPIWFPLNYLLIESLQKFYGYYTDDFLIECPTGSGQYTTINGVAQELTRRLTRLFLRDDAGRRALFGECEKFQTDPHFRDNLFFSECFHGDTGRGVGASHQTGWTGLIAELLANKQ